jgi:hypothetical protein
MGYPTKGSADRFVPGDWNVACSMCGRKRKASQMVKNWQGYYRCPEHNEARHPQDFVRGGAVETPPPYTQPQTDYEITFCTANGSSGIPGWAQPGCMIPGNTTLIPGALE